MRAPAAAPGAIALAAALLAACAYAAFAHGGVRLADATRLQIGLDIAALAAAAAWLSSGRARPLRAAREGWWGVALLAAFGAWCALTMLWSVSPDASWLAANRALAYALAVLLAIGVGSRAPRAVERVALGWLGVAVLVALYALGGKVAPGALAADEPVARLRAPLQYWNALSLVCMLAVPVALRIATDVSRGPRPRLAALAALYTLVLTMALTYSRGGFLALAVAMVVLTALGSARLRGLAALAAAGLATAPALAVAFSSDGLTDDTAALGTRIHDGRIFGLVVLVGLGLLLAGARGGLVLERRVRWTAPRSRLVWRSLAVLAVAGAVGSLAVLAGAKGGLDGQIDAAWHSFTRVKEDKLYDPARLVSSNSGNRWVWWKEAAGAFSDRPVGGWGAGSFATVHLRYRTTPLGVVQPHNVELQWLSETGIVGFTLALGGLLALFVAAWRRVAALRPGRERDLAVALLAGALGWLVHGTVDWDWDIPAVTLPPLIFLGVLAARPGIRPRRTPVFEDPDTSDGLGARAFALGGIALLLCAVAASAILPAWSDSRVTAAETAVGTGADPTALGRAAADADLAARLDPVAVEPLLVSSSVAVGRGRMLEAREDLLEAARRQPDDPVVWRRLAELVLQLADRDGFRRAALRALVLDPVNPDVRALAQLAIASEAPETESASATATPLPAAAATTAPPP